MSIQDDIFDIEDVLKRNNDRDAFSNIIRYMSRLETDVKQLREDKKALIKSIAMIKDE